MAANLAMTDAGSFGSWSTDQFDLPCFDFAIDRTQAGLVLPDDDPRQPWHQVGNDRIIATAHAGGWTTAYFCDRGHLRLSDTNPAHPERLGGVWSALDSGGATLLSPFVKDQTLQTRWGMGYTEWSAASRGLTLQRRVWAPFGDIPALRIDMTVGRTGSDGPAVAFIEESWGLALYPLLLGGLMTPWTNPPGGHRPTERFLWRCMMAASTTSRGVTEGIRRLYRSRIDLALRVSDDGRTLVVVPTYRGPFKARRLDQPAWFDSFPKPIFFTVLAGELLDHRLDAVRGMSLKVRPGTDGHVALAVGSIDESEVDATLDKIRAASLQRTAGEWSKLLRVQVPGASFLPREAAWHAYYLRSAQVRDDYFDATILPQGSAYSYIHGLHGAVRDYALATVPLTFLYPPGARDNLRLIMQMTRPDGVMFYSHTGVGMCTSAAMHDAPSDLPLWFLWALSEYSWATGDTTFLDESLPFYPKANGATSTVRERILLAWRYLRYQIGVGEHGMLRAGSGDWSDPISLMVKKRSDFHKRGESGFNTAMAVYVLPRAADMVESTHPEVAKKMREFAAELRVAMERAWTGRWFLRGWDGNGNSIGSEHLFLDGQVWALIAGIGGAEMCLPLVRQIKERLDDPSPIGATILDRPHSVRLGVLGRGWDCNGGVWAAMNGLLCWGYSLWDPELAWRNFEKQSLAAHARAYPHVWFGIWSGPDAFNSHWADRPGETFVHPATPMQEFPVMNSNMHALPLLALLRLAGVETTPDGIVVREGRSGNRNWTLSTPLFQCEVGSGNQQGAPTPVEPAGPVTEATVAVARPTRAATKPKAVPAATTRRKKVIADAPPAEATKEGVTPTRKRPPNTGAAPRSRKKPPT